MFAARISFRDRSTDTIFEILIQRSNESLFHACVSQTHFVDGKGIRTSTHCNYQPVFRKFADFPIITYHVEYFEEVLPNLCYTFQIVSLSHIRAYAGAELPTYVPDQIKSIFTESFIDGFVQATEAFHIARHSPMILLFNRQVLVL
jgi:hypothetical protein